MMLDDLAIKYGTDKSSKGHWYTRHYVQMFDSIREQIESVLEIGVASGGSLRMWMDYFPNALIYGLDMNGVVGDFGGRVTTYQFDQTDEANLDVFANKKLEIIIDDASHDSLKTLASLTYLFPFLQPKGWYVIEDMDGGFIHTLVGWLSNHPLNQFHMFANKGRSCYLMFLQKEP